jgi:hypothetical protein
MVKENPLARHRNPDSVDQLASWSKRGPPPLPSKTLSAAGAEPVRGSMDLESAARAQAPSLQTTHTLQSPVAKHPKWRAGECRAPSPASSHLLKSFSIFLFLFSLFSFRTLSLLSPYLLLTLESLSLSIVPVL